MVFAVASPRPSALAAITSDAIPDPFKVVWPFDVGVDHVAGLGPSVWGSPGFEVTDHGFTGLSLRAVISV
jgi:hypothetical protein